MTSNLQDFLTTRKQAIEEYLFTYVQELKIPEELKSSMLYSLEAGGKRLRPVLVLAFYYMPTEKTKKMAYRLAVL
ncbi:hypothetical protein BsIDN1_42450 [Bacillus safensis]|uniref:Uncharacterized protein n=1 Tax=Bacillus safensis TaxID=561879 RepID=A0A5S9MAV3_BACIA|nr:hypothetical protein BsIDN1_42450 [Bacillus safensis]